MKISKLVRKDVKSCSVHDTLERAAQLMWDHDVGCLPVVDAQGHVAGMLTDRDICMAAYTQGQPLRGIPVSAAMAKHVFACTEGEDITAVEETMSRHQIRRMPVIDGAGHPIGIVSLNDIARASAEGRVPPAEVASTLAAICAPRKLSTLARA